MPRVAEALAWLVEDGATACDALTALLAGIEVDDQRRRSVGLDPRQQCRQRVARRGAVLDEPRQRFGHTRHARCLGARWAVQPEEHRARNALGQPHGEPCLPAAQRPDDVVQRPDAAQLERSRPAPARAVAIRRRARSRATADAPARRRSGLAPARGRPADGAPSRPCRQVVEPALRAAPGAPPARAPALAHRPPAPAPPAPGSARARAARRSRRPAPCHRAHRRATPPPCARASPGPRCS